MEKSSPKNWPDVSKCTPQGKITVRLPFSDCFQRGLTTSWGEITGLTQEDIAAPVGLSISPQQIGFHQAAGFLAGSAHRTGPRSTSSLRAK